MPFDARRRTTRPTRASLSGMHIDEFNQVDGHTAAEIVTVWARVPAWVDAIVAQRPYPSAMALTEAATRSAAAWTAADLDAAIGDHPRIGERASGENAQAAASHSEQSAMSRATSDIQADIALGNARYEQRFGRVFLIRAAGRSPENIRSELYRRLQNTPEAETAEAIDQLRQIALLRLRAAIADTRGARR